MSDRLRWGLLGTARIARVIVARLKDLPRHEVVAVASRSAARAASYASEWGVPRALGSYQALLDRDDIDVVYVALPNARHAEWTLRAVRAGKHVLCEKPLALTVADVDEIAEAAARADVRVAEAFAYRHHPQTARVLEIMARGDVGPPRLVRGAFSFDLDRPGDIRWQPALGGGVLWDIGCYLVSYARLVFGTEPLQAFAVAGRHASGVDANCAGLLRFGSERVGLFDCSYRSALRTEVEIVGSDAVLQIPVPFKPGPSERLHLVRGERRVTLDVTGEPSYRGQLEDMARQVLDGSPPGLPLEDSRGNTAALVALHRSITEQCPVVVAGMATEVEAVPGQTA
jgi:predicted dehydrogenase